MKKNSSISGSVFIPLINIIIVAGLLYYLYINADQYLGLLSVSIPGIISLLLLASTSPLINGFINAYMFQAMDVKLGLKDGYYLAAASTLANELPVSGGIFAKGYYLKSVHQLSYTTYFSASLAFFVCIVAVNGGIGLAILLFWMLFKHTPTSLFLWVGFGAMTSTLFLFLLPLKHKSIPDKLRLWIDKFLDGWISISRNPQLLLKLIFFQTVLMFVFAVRYWLAFHMLSQNVTYSQAMLFSSATVLTQLISFAPGGLGVREAIVGSISTALGFPLSASVAAVGLDRLVAIVVTVILGWRSMVVLGKQISLARASKQKV